MGVASRQESFSATEKRVIVLIGMVQFINILDFMMVMPLGPDFAAELGIAAHRLGWIGGAYTAAAFISGIAGAFFLDRMNRKTAMLGALIGLSFGTLAGAWATNFGTLVAARLLAGWFGGPATSMALSIVSDQVPASRRGRAMGLVMLAFSLASIFGVPVGLELARLGGWRLPFIGVGLLCLLLTIVAAIFLPGSAPAERRNQGESVAPSHQGPLSQKQESTKQAGVGPSGSLGVLLSLPKVWMGYGMLAVGMFSGFLLIPNISTYVQGNLGLSRERLGSLYLFGGTATFLTVRWVGRWIDRVGATRVIVIATVLHSIIIYFFMIREPNLPVAYPYIIFLFSGFMLLMSSRGVAIQTLNTQIPSQATRASFMSLQNSVQHLAGAAGSGFSSLLLSSNAEGALQGISRVAIVALGASWIAPWLAGRLERKLRNEGELSPDS